MPKKIGVLLLAALFMFLSSFEVIAAEVAEEKVVLEKKTIKRRFDPIEINGEYLDKFLGKPFIGMRLFAYEDDEFKLIPYQFDERRDDMTYILPQGSAGDDKNLNGLLEPHDELVFMVEDCGHRISPEKFLSEATFFEEIVITDPLDRSTGWAYLAYFQDVPKAPEAEFKPKVWLEDDPNAFIMHGTTYIIGGLVNEIGGKVYKTAINNRLIIPKEAGGSGENIFDRMKTRAWASLLFGLIKIKVNENNVIGELDQYKEGSVRAYGRNWLQIALPTKIANFKSPKMYLDIFCYNTMILIPMTVHVPFNAKLAGVKAGMSYGYDLNENAFGMKFYNSENTEGFLIDGKPSAAEKKMDHGIDKWRCVTGPQGTMVTSSVWDAEYLKMGEVRINYIDDLKEEIEPENIPGQIGYHYNQSVTSWSKPGYYDALLCWFFPPHFYDPKRFKIEIIDEYEHMRVNPVWLKVGEHSIKNPGGWPDMLIPKRKSD